MQQDSIVSPSIWGMCRYGCKLGHHQLVQCLVFGVMLHSAPKVPLWSLRHPGLLFMCVFRLQSESAFVFVTELSSTLIVPTVSQVRFLLISLKCSNASWFTFHVCLRITIGICICFCHQVEARQVSSHQFKVQHILVQLPATFSCAEKISDEVTSSTKKS